jgi:hypothetical protein
MPDYTYQQVTIKAGECFNLPANSELIYASNPTDLSSECDIPTSFTLNCYSLAWEIISPDGPPYDDARFVGVTIDNVFYPFTSANPLVGRSDSANQLQDTMLSDVPEGLFIEGATCDIGGTGQYIYFQSVGTTITFKISNPTGTTVGTTVIYLIPEENQDCECPS